MNGNCEFMQSHNHFKNEAQCRQQVEIQKQVMIKQASNARDTTMKIELLEGTCIVTRIENIRNKT
jgi:hypothetical protein